MENKLTSSQYVWVSAGRQDHKFKKYTASCYCATCGGEAGDNSALVSDIDNKSFSDQSFIFKNGTQYVCQSCAWLFSVGTAKPGNYIAYQDRFEQTVISLESIVQDKRPWLNVLREISMMDSETLVCGVMTTDVKPRLWPRTKLSTIGNFGLYVHAPDYDISEYLEFDLKSSILLIDRIVSALEIGFSKKSIYYGLGVDYARFSRNCADSIKLEKYFSEHRNMNHFIPSLIAANILKKDKTIEPIKRNVRPAKSASEISNQHCETLPGLF